MSDMYKLDKDFMYLVLDYTWGMNDELNNMGKELSDKEEDFICCLDTWKHQDLLKVANDKAAKYDMSVYQWLLQTKSYLKYQFLFASKTDKLNYMDNLICFLAEKLSLIDSVLATLTD